MLQAPTLGVCMYGCQRMCCAAAAEKTPSQRTIFSSDLALVKIGRWAGAPERDTVIVIVRQVALAVIMDWQK